MNFKDLIKAMRSIEETSMLSEEVVISALSEAISKAYRKHIEIPDVQVRVDFNHKDNQIHVFQQRTIVEEVEDEELEISLEDAKKVDFALELGGVVEEEVTIDGFGRAAVLLAKNVLKQKIREAQKQNVYDEYIDKLEEMVIGVVDKVEERFVLVNLDKAQAMMPKSAQMPQEKYREGQRIRVIISEVNKDTKGSQVLVSRADANLVKRLFELEVPEIYSGVVEIKAIAREAGERTKMAVYSHRPEVDAIGSCIGPRGSRVQVVIEELKGEKIDIFEWSDNVSELIKNALAPAQVLAVLPMEDSRNLLVVVENDQLSLAIGKKGKNARLAVKLTNSKIDIKSESEVAALGVDYKAIYEKQQAELAAKLAEKRAKAQQEHFEARKETETNVFDEDLFDEIEYASEEIEEVIEVEDTLAAKEESAVVEVVETVEEEKEETELEKAARIAKEKKAKEGLDIASKQEYVSKFESIAGAAKTQTTTVKRKKKQVNVEEEEEIVRKPTFDLKKEYEMKPIYSEEELEEIARQEEEEFENDWINEDIDFDEYDEYYD